MTKTVMRAFYVYILASRKNGTLYMGVSSNLSRRTWEHREGLKEGFTKRHSVKRLVYIEEHQTAETPSNARRPSNPGRAAGRSNSSKRAIPNGSICTGGSIGKAALSV
jgi:predicted GIY-YIG superfamily endonuclease